ncbi:(R)-mandelonitrile lyase [Glacieibacterium megasporae]|uniref:(R)-mandelonitrile lyase n=1 Tax=Glacieibacterium megasporae TaxID=2835787 RepID=UPI001C1E8B4F|nr:cupin domain-containing protein [Polymorphobacter megasporae]UAJ10562.1 cupin domain-containing protein [Polymorphobacter megasporae]
MNLTRTADQRTQLGSSESFTGTAWQQTLAVGDAPAPLHVARVTFEPGARTVWHTHPRGQILIATIGIGRCQTQGGPVLALLPGDSVSIASGEKHWHGAAPDQLFVHISLQSEGEGGEQAIWLEPVSDEDYGRLPERKG